MTFSPKLIFFLTLFATIGTGIAGGTVHLTNVIPDELIPRATGIISFTTFCVMTFLTLATGYAGIGKGPLAAPPTTAEADAMKAQAVAAAVKGKQ